MTTLELVIYSVKPDQLESYGEARNKVRRLISKWDGFISGVTFRSLAKKGVFLDYYLWDSMENALGAAERIQTENDAKDFLNCIGEIIAAKHFSVDGSQPCFVNSDEGDVFEAALSIVDPNRKGTFDATKPELFDLVRKEVGLKEIASAEADTTDGTLSLDLLRWGSMEAAGTAMENIHQTEQCSIFMETFKESVYFDHMTKLAS